MNIKTNFMIHCHNCQTQNLKRVSGITSLQNASGENGHILHMSAACLDCGFQTFSYQHDSRFPDIDLTIQAASFLDTDLAITYLPFDVSVFVEVSSVQAISDFLADVDPDDLAEFMDDSQKPLKPHSLSAIQ